MADNFLITGYWGEPHITAENDRGINAAIFGTGRFVLPVGQQFRAEYIGNNTIRMYDGKLLDNGAAAGIPAGEYIDLLISNAGQGKKRNDLIVFQYAKDGATLTESGKFVVIQGTETSGTPSDPALTQQDLLSNEASLDNYALWRVPVSGTAVSAPVKLFSVRTMANTEDIATASENGFTMIQDVDTKVTNVNKDLQETKSSLATVDNRVTNVNSDLQSTKSSLATVDNKVTSVNKDLQNTKTLFETTLVQVIGDIQDDINDINEAMPVVYKMTWYPDRNNALEFNEGQTLEGLVEDLNEEKAVEFKVMKSGDFHYHEAEIEIRDGALYVHVAEVTYSHTERVEIIVHCWRCTEAEDYNFKYDSYEVSKLINQLRGGILEHSDSINNITSVVQLLADKNPIVYKMTWYPDRNNALEFNEGQTLEGLVEDIYAEKAVEFKVMKSGEDYYREAEIELLNDNLYIHIAEVTHTNQTEMIVHCWYCDLTDYHFIYSPYEVSKLINQVRAGVLEHSELLNVLGNQALVAFRFVWNPEQNNSLQLEDTNASMDAFIDTLNNNGNANVKVRIKKAGTNSYLDADIILSNDIYCIHAIEVVYDGQSSYGVKTIIHLWHWSASSNKFLYSSYALSDLINQVRGGILEHSESINALMQLVPDLMNRVTALEAKLQ